MTAHAGNSLAVNNSAVREASPQKRTRLIAFAILAVFLAVFLVSVWLQGVDVRVFSKPHFVRQAATFPQTMRTLCLGIFGGKAISAAGGVNEKILQWYLPSCLSAVLVGAGLSIAGSSFQGLFQNPMASPSLIGVPGASYIGCALGVGLWIANPGLSAMPQILGFLFGLGGMVLVMFLASRAGRGTVFIVDLLLIGLMLTTFYQAVVSLMVQGNDLLKVLLSFFQRTSPQAYQFYQDELSSLSTRSLLPESFKDFGAILWPILAGVVPLLIIRWRVTALSFGEEEARSVGINTRFVKVIVILCATLITSTVVAFCGMIGWVGLVIPHICRSLVGSDYRRLMPVSVFAGGIFMLLVNDTLVFVRHTLMFSSISAICALVGTPVFFYLLGQGRRAWS
ncbi:MAG: iron ABC transporter permease [Ethanoligenens sp.]